MTDIENELTLIRKALEALLDTKQFELYQKSVKTNPTLTDYILHLNEQTGYMSLSVKSIKHPRLQLSE